MEKCTNKSHTGKLLRLVDFAGNESPVPRIPTFLIMSIR